MPFKSILITIFLLISCYCFADGLQENEIPMYGGDKISDRQKKINEKYICEVIKAAGSKEAAAKHAIMRGWEYFHKGDLKTSIKRFNQAWLLTPNDPQIFWGFGVILGQLNIIVNSITMLEKALTLDNKNNRIMTDLGFAYFKFAVIKGEKEGGYIEKALELYIKAESIDKKHGVLYNNWAVILMFLGKYDEAWGKLQYAISIGFKPNPNFINDLKSRISE